MIYLLVGISEGTFDNKEQEEYFVNHAGEFLAEIDAIHSKDGMRFWLSGRFFPCDFQEKKPK